MLAYAAIPLICWLCALVATPGKPLPGNEVEELVYARLLGRQGWLKLLALVVTAASFLILVLTLPAQLDPDLGTQRSVSDYCNRTSAAAPSCVLLGRDGSWIEARRQGGGSWWIVAQWSAGQAEPVAVSDPYESSLLNDDARTR